MPGRHKSANLKSKYCVYSCLNVCALLSPQSYPWLSFPSDLISLWTPFDDIRFHSSVRAKLSWATFFGGFGLFLNRRSNSSRTCSIGDRSGLCWCQSSVGPLFATKKSRNTVDTCGRALSRCNVNWWWCAIGITWSCSTWPVKRMAVMFLWMITPHTITEPFALNYHLRETAWTVIHI